MLNNSKINLIKIALGLLSVFLLFFFVGTFRNPLIFDLKKVSLPLITDSTPVAKQNIIKTVDSIILRPIADSSVSDSSLNTPISKIQLNKSASDTFVARNSESDTLYDEKILLFGDSQLEGLRNPIYGYCIGNNHKLVSTVLWYGSSTKQWGNTDTLDYFIRKYKPTMVLFAIGLNELFVNDLTSRKTYIDNILAKFKKFNVKYFWIGPAAWTKDKGVINVMQQEVGTNFYPSHLLTLDRANDKRHPSRNASKIWFDSVAVYITKNCKINFSKKTTILPKIKDTPLIILSQVK